MLKEGLTFRQKAGIGVSVGLAWVGGMGFTANKYIDTREEVKADPLLRTYDQLDNAKKNLTYTSSHVVGRVITPGKNPDKEVAVNDLIDAAEAYNHDDEVSAQINGAIAELKSKKSSTEESYYEEDRKKIDRIMSELGDNPSFRNVREERDFYKFALLAQGVITLIGTPVGGVVLYFRKHWL